MMEVSKIMNKTLCLFGIYDPKYSRNRVLAEGFAANGWEVVECRVDPRVTKGLAKYVELWKIGRSLRRSRKFDLVIVAFPGQTVAWLGRLIFGKDIVLDAFLSLYDSNVYDRKLYSAYSLRAIKDYFFDWLSVKITRRTLLDTNEHIKYFVKTFRVPENKFARLLISADEKVFRAQDASVATPSSNADPISSPAAARTPTKFIVEFHGMFIPLQGVEYILRAAAILKSDTSIIFNIIGHGQTFKECKKLAEELALTNVNFIGQVPVEKLPSYISEADICLGIFGNTEKTKRVIPNKVYECAAMGKAIITSDTPAIREVFMGGHDMLFSRTADSEDLAEKIKLLREDEALRMKIALGARKTFDEKCHSKAIVDSLIRDLGV